MQTLFDDCFGGIHVLLKTKHGSSYAQWVKT